MLSFLRSILLAFLLGQFTVYAQTGTDREIAGLMEEYKAVGLSVAVVRDGKVVYTQAYGKKKREQGQDLKSDDLFRIASISKSFTATAMMQLVEAGKVKLTDDVSDLIGFRVRHPDYPQTVITLKMILSHTSSLNDSQGYFTLDAIDPATNPDAAKCYNKYEPGKGYQYCNLNFNIAGTIVERVSGVRFDEYVRRNVLKPSGLYGGYCVDSLDAGRLATLYEYNAETDTFSPQPNAYHPRREELRTYNYGRSTPVFSPTGGMKISAPDLAAYMNMHAHYGKLGGKRIISKKSARLMQTPVENAKGYGLALTRMDQLIPGQSLVGHTGSAYGLFSIMTFNPEKKWGIVAITNGCKPVYTNDRNEFLARVVNVLYKGYVEVKK